MKILAGDQLLSGSTWINFQSSSRIALTTEKRHYRHSDDTEFIDISTKQHNIAN